MVVICECIDKGCPVHIDSVCRKVASVIVYRIDMQDEMGTVMCCKCADDACESGLFITEEEKVEQWQEQE